MTSSDRFMLAADSEVRGRHVLLVEDTWTTGGNAQSAALTLRHGGAASVTIVALARWLKLEEPNWGVRHRPAHPGLRPARLPGQRSGLHLLADRLVTWRR